MLFSCKISDSLLTYLGRHGEDVQLFDDAIALVPEIAPLDFLRDPSYWIEAPKMEALLRVLLTHFEAKDPGFIVKAGHGSRDLRAWGTLDSVLRMVQNPKDLYSQPARLLSYFISPAPPIGNVVRSGDSVGFEIPVVSSQYPLVSEYIRAAFESLPTYTGKTLAEVTWVETRITIEWAEQQGSMLDESAPPTLNPEVVQSVMADLERSQKQLEETNRLLHLKEKELEALRAQMAGPMAAAAVPLVTQTRAQLPLNPSPLNLANSRTVSVDGTETVSETVRVSATATDINDIVQHVYRLGDYFGRSQQLVTLLVAQDRMSPQVQEAMRRVDWPRIQAESRHVVTEAALQLKKLQKRMEDPSCQKLSPSTPAKF